MTIRNQEPMVITRRNENYLLTVEECLLLRDEHNNIMIKMKKSEYDLVVSSYETVLAYGFPLPRKEATIDHYVFRYTVVYYY